jgi:hypothetical protein
VNLQLLEVNSFRQEPLLQQRTVENELVANNKVEAPGDAMLLVKLLSVYLKSGSSYLNLVHLHPSFLPPFQIVFNFVCYPEELELQTQMSLEIRPVFQNDLWLLDFDIQAGNLRSLLEFNSFRLHQTLFEFF